MLEQTSESAVLQTSDDPADADLRKLIRTIVRDFDGDTSAFFRSLQPKAAENDLEVEKEIKIARRFAKSI